MTAVFSSQTIRSLEQRAFDEGLTERSALMEQAGRSVFCAVRRLSDVGGKRIVVLCGSGNNGGDGYVCARLLAQQGAWVTVVPVGEPASEGCREMAARYTGERVCPAEATAVLRSADIVIEAVYGTGFHGALGEEIRALFRAIAPETLRVAIDLPAGLTADGNQVAQGAFAAHWTVTFFGYKPCLIHQPSAALAGRVQVETLEMSESFLAQFPREGTIGEPPVFAPRHPGAHKGTFGTVGALVGHYGMAGAALLCGTAALRSGCGIVKLAVEDAIYPIVTQGLPEAVCLPYETGDCPPALLTCDSLAVGCGLSTGKAPAEMVHFLLSRYTGPLILDADGLNNCVSHIEWIQESKAQTVLTPHMGEMARLCGVEVAEVQRDRVFWAVKLAKETNAIVLLKGPYTLITDGVRKVYNPTGNPGMATGGSGDVLTGVIAALCAAGTPPFESACYGAWLHGAAADRACERVGEISLMPRDILDALPDVIRECETKTCAGLPLFS